MDEAESLVRDAATRIFQDLGDPQTVNNAEDDAWRQPLWSALEDSGLTTAWVSDELGGAGAGIGAGRDGGGNRTLFVDAALAPAL